MADVGIPIIGQPEQVTQGQTKDFECVRCKAKFIVQVPEFEIVNAASVSAVVFPHPYSESCPECGQTYTFIIGAVKGIAFGWTPARKANQPNIVTVPAMPGLKI